MYKVCTFSIFWLTCFAVSAKKYKANWDSLDSRPLPNWYDDGKIGIFIHFGVYSVPSFKSGKNISHEN